MATITKKTAFSLLGKSTAQKSHEDKLWQEVWGKRMLNSALGGLGLGAGGTGLYYLYQGLANRKAGPLVADNAITGDAAAFTAKNKKDEEDDSRRKAANTKFDLKNIPQTLGGALPKSWLDFIGGAGRPGKALADPNTTRAAFGTTAVVGGGGLGLLAGHHLLKGIHERKRQQDIEDEVAEAAREYHDALMGQSKKATTQKSAVVETARNVWDGAWDLAGNVPGVNALSGAISTPLVMTSAGMGGLAMYLMYERARGLSRNRAAEAAAKSKARLAGTASDYVDPDELSEIKRLAK